MIFYPQQKILKNKSTLPLLPTTGIFKPLWTGKEIIWSIIIKLTKGRRTKDRN
jgi:hypothetical protein